MAVNFSSYLNSSVKFWQRNTPAIRQHLSRGTKDNFLTIFALPKRRQRAPCECGLVLKDGRSIRHSNIPYRPMSSQIGVDPTEEKYKNLDKNCFYLKVKKRDSKISYFLRGKGGNFLGHKFFLTFMCAYVFFGWW